MTSWKEDGEDHPARWRSESGVPAPRLLHRVDDRLPADVAYKRVRRGEFLLYRGDYRNATQLLSALGRRLERAMEREAARRGPPPTLAEAFRAERRARLAEHDLLSRLVVPLDAEYRLALKHAPDVRESCRQVWGEPDAPRTAVALRELLGMLGAAEWRRKGVFVKALGEEIHPHYGVFAPTRQEYVDLVAGAPFPATIGRAFDLGTGTGVLAALLARRGAAGVVATDLDPRCLACARENVARLKLEDRIRVEQVDLFPEGQADLIVCNPPWIPETPRTPVDRAIFDPDSTFLKRFIAGLPEHLAPGGQGWLVLSNLAELLGLRPEGFLAGLFERAGLRVAWTRETAPRHPKASDPSDPLHAARSREVTRLYCLMRA